MQDQRKTKQELIKGPSQTTPPGQLTSAGEEKYRRLFETATIGIFQSSPEGKVITANPEFANMFGYESPEDVIDYVQDIGADMYVDPQRRDEIVRLIVENPNLKSFDNLYRRKDGSTFPGNLHIWPVYDADGRLLTIEGFVEDISERRKAEDELTKYREGLEQIVEERTRELEKRTKTLEEVNIALKVLLKHREEDRKEMEDRFVMNTKNLILPYAEKMKKTRLDERQLAYLSIMETHLNEITSGMIKIFHQFNLTPTEVEVASLIREGKATKDIARIMGIATSSIDTHRNNIRKKLGISKKNVNLRSHLQSFI